MGFYLEPKDYGKKDWLSLIAKVKKKLNVWYN